MQQSQPEDWFHSLPFQRFQTLLTLFSKSFSSFPHGTCLLSVSNQYLALDEIYHPLYAPIPRNATLRRYAVHGGLQMTNGTLTLVDALFQEAYICASVGSTSQDYNSRSGDPNFHAELIPVHSPLLRESYLVSFPPLTYMLKFSGFADLTSCCAWDKLLRAAMCGWSAARICNKSEAQAHKLQKLQLSSNTPACATHSTRKRSHGTQRRR